MVSTRGVRYKFSEGERVLCYEPDPTKAKVLYDSKVLEVIESKDKRGRRMVEYLIHFQGWNSSWDRCVGEDFVLKDTEENRQLQRDLAEKSQLQLGAYLYRRERKKGGPVAAKRPRQGFSDDGSSTSTQPDEAETAGDTDSSMGSSGSQVSEPAPQLHPARAQIVLPPTLRDRLTFDYHLISKRGRLSVLPSSPSVAEILESFVKWFARSGAWRPPDPPNKPNMLDVCCRLNLVREVADGLRVYFDFIVRDHLLYKQEADQYHEACGQHMDREEEQAAAEAQCENESSDDEDAETADSDSATLPLAAVEDDIKSPKIPEYAHLPPDPVLDSKSDTSRSSPDGASSNEKGDSSDKETTDRQSQDGNHSGNDKDRDPEERGSTRSATVARRLRSHKSVVSQPETDEPAPSTSGCETKNDNMSSSVGSSGGSSVSSGWASRVTSKPPPPPTPRTALSLLLDKVAKWQIIPREGTEHLPCRVYGAIHLARLFVKLPDFLNATQMPDLKLKLVLKHIDMFVQFLDEHNEWFGEMYYLGAESISRCH